MRNHLPNTLQGRKAPDRWGNRCWRLLRRWKEQIVNIEDRTVMVKKGSAMNKRKGSTRPPKTIQKKNFTNSRNNLISLVIVVLLVIVVTVIWTTQKKQQTPPPPVIAVTGQPDRTILQSLVGKWIRPDGGYVVLVRSVYPDGTIDAEYLNPRPIHISQAQASGDGDTARLFIELSDVGYPGSTYTLTYKRETDVLTGIYYQAVQGQEYDVLFVRSQ